MSPADISISRPGARSAATDMDPSLLHGGQILTDRESSSAPVCLRCREMADRCWQLVADRCYQAALEETWSFSPVSDFFHRVHRNVITARRQPRLRQAS